MDEKMKFTDYIRPPMEAGRYVVRASQKVTQPAAEEFKQETDFYITCHAFTLSKEDVFSCFPASEESGEFETVLPYIVMEKRTFPWEQTIAREAGGVPVPWVALIVLAEGEATEQDLTVKDLLSGKARQGGVYFPDKSKLPSVYCEGEEDLCHVVDVPKKLLADIMPSVEDLPFLCHVKNVNLAKTEDEICEKDGFFSVVCGNRLIPSGTDTAQKSTVHLVSMLGYGDLTGIPDCERVRFVSLFHWNVYSKRQSEENFPTVIERLRKNCGVMGYDRDTELRRKGYSVKEHITRTGEKTYSLYRSPLLPFFNEEELDTRDRHTADGRLIYDQSVGVLDVTYSAAWQLGRMVTLSQPSMAGEIQQERAEEKQERHQRLVKHNFHLWQSSMERVLSGLLKQGQEEGEGYEKDIVRGNESGKGGQIPSVFRGYR